MNGDDVKVCKTIHTAEDLKAVQTAIDFTSSWADKWRLPLATEMIPLLEVGFKNHNLSADIRFR